MNTRSAWKPSAWKPRIIVALLVFPGAGALQTASAAELGFYVGGFFGQSTKAAEIAAFDDFGQVIYSAVGFTATQTTSTLDDKDSAYGFQAGYRLTPHIAFEGGYVDLGALAYRAESPGSFVDGPSTLNLNIDSETTGIALSVLGILPLSYRWEVYARGGALFATNTFHVFIADNEGASARDESSESSTDYFAGAGISLSFLEIYNARLEFQRVFDAGDESTGEGDLDLISLGVTVGF